jgi:hypothetical protein
MVPHHEDCAQPKGLRAGLAAAPSHGEIDSSDRMTVGEIADGRCRLEGAVDHLG